MSNEKVAVLVNVLKEKSFKKLYKIENYTMAEVDYFKWKQKPAGRSSNLNQGFGAIDSHYQLHFSVELDNYHELTEQSFCFIVKTTDTDMWNTNNPQIIVVVNDQVLRALDMNHNYFLLPKSIDTADIWLNIYTNTNKPDVFIETWAAYRQECVYQLYHQVKALYEYSLTLRAEEFSLVQVERLLVEVSDGVLAVSADEQQFLTQVHLALQTISHWLEENEQSENSIVEHVVGHTHIDISWLWNLDQTKEKVVRSFSNALYLMEQYPEMTFMSSTPLLYEMLETQEPELFEKLTMYVKNCRWQPEGAMYVESDTNLPSGEALIRQIYYGKKYFYEKFGRDSKILWLPDCFGFSGSLPQLLKKSGINYFFTSKLDWNDTNKFPNDTFYWRGIDGSEILSHMLTTSNYSSSDQQVGTTYNGRLNASQVKGTWTRYKNKSLSNHVMQIYGFGDGGGGPTEEMLENSRVFTHGLPGLPMVKHSQPLNFFEKLQLDAEKKADPPIWSGELYLETHRGVYTTDGRLKKLNRSAETMLKIVEFLGGFSGFLMKDFANYPQNELETTWKLLLINQFHDILPGTSIQKVHEEAVGRYEQVIDNCYKYLQKIFSSFNLELVGLANDFTAQNLATKDIDTDYYFFNPTSFERDLVFQVDDHVMKISNIPSLGYKRMSGKELFAKIDSKFSEYPENSECAGNFYCESEQELQFETPQYIVKMKNTGEFLQLYSKQLQKNLVRKDMTFNQICYYADHPKEFDAWNIERDSLVLLEITEVAEDIQIIMNHPEECQILIKKMLGNSHFTQKIIFYRDNKRIDFVTTVDWQEQYTLAKVRFPVDICQGQANYDIQFGNIQRSNYWNTSWDKAKYEVCAHKWADLSEEAYGVAVLNDCKYGYSIEKNDLYLTLLKSPQYPAPDIDRGMHTFTYSVYPHLATFKESAVYEQAYALNIPVVVAKSIKKDITQVLIPSQLIRFSEANIIVETIKKAENNDALIIRCYESIGKTTSCTIQLFSDVSAVGEVDLMENETDKKIECLNRTLNSVFKPYEIKTFVVKW